MEVESIFFPGVCELVDNQQRECQEKINGFEK